jgi:hypothetical protein
VNRVSGAALRFSAIALVVGVPFVACATATGPGDGTSSGGDGGSATDAAPFEGGPRDAMTCTLGSADHCGACTTVCAGIDDKGTLRTCSDSNSAGMCSIQCKGEFYDLDGKDTNGCEAEDPIVQDTPATAVAVMLISGPTNPKTIVGTIFGDTRLHDAPPTARPLGREDWRAVSTTGVGKSGTTSAMSACLGISNFPTDNTFEVCVSKATITTFDTAECKTVIGGAASVCVGPATGANLTGPFYVRVKKIAGTNVALGYALYLEH